jgi:hypothetical protein
VRDLAQLVEQIALGQGRREREWAAQADRGRNRLIDETVERVIADDTEHVYDVAVARRDVPANERVGVLERNGHDGSLVSNAAKSAWLGRPRA